VEVPGCPVVGADWAAAGPIRHVASLHYVRHERRHRWRCGTLLARNGWRFLLFIASERQSAPYFDLFLFSFDLS
jgi:hypothetical protein